MRLDFKGGVHQAVDLSRQRTSIGRDASNDVILDAAGISGFHAEIHNEDGQLFLVDLGSTNGSFVNGQRVSGRRELKAWDTLAFDSLEAELVDPDRRRPTQVRAAITDDMLDSNPNATRVRPVVSDWRLEGGAGTIMLKMRTVFGRDEGCDVTLSGGEVSRKHAELTIEGEQLFVQDLESANGTFVNGKRVTRASLADGDELRFDVLSFVVRGGPKPADAGKTVVRRALDMPDPAATAVRTAGAGGGATQVMSAPAARLVGVSPLVAGRSFELRGPTTIGREPGATIVIDDSTVSATHCRLTEIAGVWQIEDLGSTNGLAVNGSRVERAALNPTDRILVGKVEFRFEAAASPARGATQVMSSVPGETRTSVHPIATRRVPSWAYGLAGFALVAVAALGFVFKDQLFAGGVKPIDAPLQAGRVWEQALPEGRNAPTTPVVADINGDKVLDLIVADARGFLLALDGEQGKRIFEVDIADRLLAPPAAADLTGNGQADIVVATHGGLVMAYDGKGQLLWRSGAELDLGPVVNRPALADVNGDGIPDVIVPTARKGLVALDGARGWKLWDTAEMTRGAVVSSPLAVDLNADGIIDFVAVTDSGQLFAVSSQGERVWQLWQAQLPPVMYASPTYAVVDNRGLVITATDGGLVAVVADSGRMAWQKALAGRFFASPLVANFGGSPHVVAASLDGKIHALDAANGDESWSIELGAGIKATPALFDFTNDRLPDLLVLDERGNLHIIDGGRGRAVLQSGLSGADEFVASPVLADLTGDGLLELAAASQNGRILVHTFNRTVAKATAPWPTFLGNNQHALQR